MGASLRIGIFGGSFNPPHNGHVGACHYCFAQNVVDRILIIPCFIHPYQKPLAPYAHRIAMCRAAFDPVTGVEVSAIERELGGISHTVRTVRRLKELYPGATLSLMVGDDLQAEMALWKDVDAIRENAQFFTIKRGSGSPIPGVSATEIRDRIANGQSIADLVPPAVAAYIAAYHLYTNIG